MPTIVDMNDSDMSDLKQFIQITITNAVTQSEMRIIDILTDHIDERIEETNQRIDELRQETSNKFDGVADAIENLGQLIDSDHKETDKHLTKLERKLA